MIAANALLRSIVIIACLPLFCISDVQADAPVVVWDSKRTTSPDSITELKALQERVKDVVKRVTPLTVGLEVEFNATNRGAGSGVIVSEDGLVLTAAHVVGRPGTPISFVMSNGYRVRGKSLGVNPTIDSGMAKIIGKPPETGDWPGAKDGKWPVAELGKAGSLKKGQWVLSLGHPGGPKQDRPPPIRVGRFYFAMTSGREPIVRTDCTLVGGDSGGPLFDLDGKLIGIHSRIGKELDYNIHIPAEAFVKEWDDLSNSKVIGDRGSAELGIILNKDQETPTVESVTEGGPAEKGKMKPGDVILKFNDEPVHTGDDLKHMLMGQQPGDVVSIEVQRNGNTEVLSVKLGRKRAPSE